MTRNEEALQAAANAISEAAHTRDFRVMAEAALDAVLVGPMSTHPLAADLLDEQLDRWTLQGVSERRRLQLLRTFLPPATWAVSPTPELLAAIARTEKAIQDTDDLCADIRGAIEKLRTP